MNGPGGDTRLKCPIFNLKSLFRRWANHAGRSQMGLLSASCFGAGASLPFRGVCTWLTVADIVHFPVSLPRGY